MRLTVLKKKDKKRLTLIFRISIIIFFEGFLLLAFWNRGINRQFNSSFHFRPS